MYGIKASTLLFPRCEYRYSRPRELGTETTTGTGTEIALVPASGVKLLCARSRERERGQNFSFCNFSLQKFKAPKQQEANFSCRFRVAQSLPHTWPINKRSQGISLTLLAFAHFILFSSRCGRYLTRSKDTCARLYPSLCPLKAGDLPSTRCQHKFRSWLLAVAKFTLACNLNAFIYLKVFGQAKRLNCSWPRYSSKSVSK